MPSQDLLNGLNASQQAAVQSIDGPHLMLAGPGSGKTRVITHRIAYMISQGISPRDIVGLTFTNKAAGEMRRRLDVLIGPTDVWLGTFHGFCVRLLRRYSQLVGLPVNFNIYDVDDSLACLKQAVKDSNIDLSHTPVSRLAQRISFYKNRLVTPEVLQADPRGSSEYQVSQIYPHYQQALLACGAVDFDDILMHTALMLREHAELREQLDERFRYMLVDEYQDTNLAQYVILRQLCVDHPNLAATGDPDQSIYGWRGANTQNVANLERDYPNLRIIRLEDNYRSTPEILSLADCLIQNNQYRKHKQLVPSRPAGHKVRLTIYPTARAEAEDIADQIVAWTKSTDHPLSDFGILYRTNAQSRLLEQAMVRRQLPYQLIGGFRFYLRKEIKDLIGYVLLVNNPNDDIACQRVINVPPRGIGKQTVEKLRRFAHEHQMSLLEACRIAGSEKLLSSRATIAVRDFVRLMDRLNDQASGSLVSLLQTTLDETRYREFVEKSARSDQDQLDLGQNIDELLAEAHEIDGEIDGDTHDSRSSLERFLELVALQSDVDKLKTDRNVVTLMTLHAAKGLEFPCVYLIAVEENILPHARSKDDPMQLEEERRLLFVGITRAKDRLQVSYARSRGFGGSSESGIPSSFLMELPRREMLVQDRCDDLGSDYNDAGNYDAGEDFSDQFSPDPSDLAGGETIDHDDLTFDYDDSCQLPPEELKQRRLKKAQRRTGSSLTTGASLADSQIPWEKFRQGVHVSHPLWGNGQIVQVSGHGPKRAVSVVFSDTGLERTFRLSHAPLRLEG